MVHRRENFTSVFEVPHARRRRWISFGHGTDLFISYSEFGGQIIVCTVNSINSMPTDRFKQNSLLPAHSTAFDSHFCRHGFSSRATILRVLLQHFGWQPDLRFICKYLFREHAWKSVKFLLHTSVRWDFKKKKNAARIIHISPDPKQEKPTFYFAKTFMLERVVFGICCTTGHLFFIVISKRKALARTVYVLLNWTKLSDASLRRKLKYNENEDCRGMCARGEGNYICLNSTITRAWCFWQLAGRHLENLFILL